MINEIYKYLIDIIRAPNFFEVLMTKIFILCFFFTITVISKEITPNDYFLIEDLIEYQTSQIENASSKDVESLSEKLCSRGESYLFLEKYIEALKDF